MIGNFGDPYKIQLSEHVSPYALYTHKVVSISLRQKFIEELEHMDSWKIITIIEEPTPLHSGTVVVPKRNGTVSI